MTFGSEINLYKATLADLDEIKRIVDDHKQELGFVIRPALAHSIDKSELIVAKLSSERVVGFAHYRHRKDGQTTLYNLVVIDEFRRKSIATRLIEALEAEARTLGQQFILLKCPSDLIANHFYKAIGYELIDLEDGKHKRLNIWRLRL